MADIVGILPHGIVQRLLVELGGWRSDGIALHEVLVLQSHHTLPLHILVQIHDGIKDICQLSMGNGGVLYIGY